mmetsp:Transcript_39121/g.65727  ORF Transcript_39121/g.65727 Transcript_39121/m.65727 type:complete len:217 (-) Transcript_39121:252-902(-)|eukprot:CAMPEP_0198211296 /NCGR_PEP_ID=MMETSP1445-20131203/23027_1 /TAXON_ID=36898 /ORGANISM="Pyramimonas sp., Strain CCMP2087" /LENGTH=216 /DNA_ID=CAMNT_0043885519 /DNA_START=85 /DNA_END=735 /DNA_ORIENTATION=+
MVLISLFRPSKDTIKQTLQDGQRQGFCYPHQGASRDFPPLPASAANHGYKIDHKRVKLGQGSAAFERAKKLLNKWEHFQLGWAQVDSDTPVKQGSPVCVTAQVAFLWTRHPLEIVYVADSEKGKGTKTRIVTPTGEPCKARYTFAHGCLKGHMLAGEERFAVEWLEDDSVWYDVAAFSKAAGPISAVSYPLVRLFQGYFGHCSLKAMERGMADSSI